MNADMKTVVSNLESGVIEIKHSLSTKPGDNSAKIEHMEDKIIQLEYSLKTKVGSYHLMSSKHFENRKFQIKK
jgi:hypothetical protein